MNKNFALILSCAVSILGLASCNNKEADILKSNDKTHTVVFQAQNPAAPETKTALRLEVVPDWRETDVKDVHIFETETIGESVTTKEAKSVKMEIVDEKNKEALFTAEFPNAEIIVNPPSATTKASTSSTYQYTAIMATREGDKYVVPSVQYPHDEAWIDPKADMLVGSNETIFSSYQDNQELGLQFARPVALARLAITNLEGEKVEKVKITTVNNITGYLTYADVDFKNKKKQTFKSDDSDKVLTLLYPDGKNLTTTFYAYFVCVPQKIQFSKIEVFTDEYVFTKTYSTSTPPSLTFTAGDFMNIALDMTPKDNNGVTRTGLGEQTLTFVDDDENAVTAIEFDLVNGKDKFVAPTLVIGDNVVDKTAVTITSNNEEVATVDDEGKVSLTGATGEVTITAAVPGDETHAAGYASYTITVTDTTAPETVTFYKAEEIEAGKEYVIVSGGKALTADLGAQDVTIENDTFEAEPDKYTLWTAAARVAYYEGTSAAGHFTLENGDNYLQRKSNQSEQTLIVGAEPSNGKYYVWDYDGQHLDHLTLGNNTLYHYCVNYDDGWVVTSVADANNATYPTTVLYSTSKPRTKQVISFGEQPVTAKYDLNGAKWTVEVPTISGNKTDVTYSISGDESIKVNATSGEVTIENTAKKGDKATVTATAAQTDEYTSATASYTIEIIDSSTPSTTATYTLVTKQEDVVEGKYLIVSAADAYIFDGTGTYTGGYTTIADADAITLNENKITITGETAAFDFTFAKSGDGFTITGEKGMIVAAEHSGASTSTETYITFAQTGGSVFLQRGSLENKPEALLFSTTRGTSSNEYLYYHTTNKIFKIGGSGSSNGIHLYFAGERAEQNIAYSKATDSYDMASETAYAAPELSGDKTNVTYSSSNTNVATVDAEGVVTIKGKGETTITATAAATSELLSASASYTLTVTNSKVPTYYKVDELENDQKYLIVSNGYAIALNGTSVTAAAVTATETEGEIKFDEQDSAIWTATVSGTSIKVKNGNYYLRHSSSTTTNFSISDTNSNNGITYDADNNTVKLGSNYLYYSSGFKLSASAGDTHVAAFYSATKPLPKWEISYDATAAEYDVYTQGWNSSKPNLTTAASNVTYASSDETVATVSSTGEITVLKSGTTTITATAVADETHRAAKASFVLTVVNSDPNLPRYTKVTSTSDLTIGAQYILVFEGLANDPDDGDPMVFKAILNSDGTQFAKASSSAQPVKIDNSTIASDAMSDYHFTLESGYYLKSVKANRYIYPGTSGSSYSATSVIYAEATASHALTITFDNGIAWILNGERYLVWSTSNHYFSSNTKTSSSATGICLYKLEGSGGTTPEPPTPSTYTKITTLEDMTTGSNASYLIVSDTDNKIFKGAADGTAVDVTPTSNTISGSYESYEFTVEKNDDNYYVKFKDGKYLVCDYSNTGNGTTGIRYVSSTTDVTYPYSLTVTNGAFFFETKKMDPTDAHTASQYIYFKAGTGNNIFKIGGSGSSVGVHIYKKN